MDANEKVFRYYQKAVNGLSVEAREQAQAMWERALELYQDDHETLEEIVDYIVAIIEKYGTDAARVAADAYDDLRELALGSAGRFEHSPTVRTYMAEYGDAELGDKAREKVAPAIADALAAGLLYKDTKLEAVIDVMVTKQARKTMKRNIRKDKWCLGYQIIPSNALPCSFCAMLAGRGTIRKGSGEQLSEPYHDHCHCQPYPVWDEKPYWFSENKYEGMYFDALHALENGDYSDELKARMEREKEEKGRDFTKTHQIMAVMRERSNVSDAVKPKGEDG